MTEGYVDVPTGRIHYESRGKGHPVVLIHAGIVDSRQWDREISEFSTRFHVVRYDVRGYGRSSAPAGPYSDSEDLEALLTHLDIDRPMLVGVSNGGRIAIDYALEHRDSVEAIVPVCSALGGFRPKRTPNLRAILDASMQNDQKLTQLFQHGDQGAVVDALREYWAPAAPKETRPLLDRMLAANLKMSFSSESLSVPITPAAAERLGEVRAPTLVVSAELDEPLSHFISDEIARGIPGAIRHEISEADHLANVSQPVEFDRVVLEFLE